MNAQLYRTMFAAAILLTASAARAADPDKSSGRDEAPRIASAVAMSPDAAAPGDRSAPAAPGESRDAGLHLDCPCSDPDARGEAGVRSGFTDPGAQLVWIGP